MRFRAVQSLAIEQGQRAPSPLRWGRTGIWGLARGD